MNRKNDLFLETLHKLDVYLFKKSGTKHLNPVLQFCNQILFRREEFSLTCHQFLNNSAIEMAVDKTRHFEEHDIVPGLSFKVLFIQLHMDHIVSQVTRNQLLELALAHLDNLGHDV